MNWQNGFFFSTYRSGKIEKSGREIGGLIGRLIVYLPFIAAACLIYRPQSGDGNLWLWNGMTLAAITISLVMLKTFLMTSLGRRVQGRWTSALIYRLAELGFLLLQLLVLRMAIIKYLSPGPSAHPVANLAALSFIALKAIRWIRSGCH